MADKKSVKRKRKGQSDDSGTPTKEEKKVAQYLRFNLQTKKATYYGNEAFYFFGDKAIDYLLDSKWAKTSKGEVTFTHRESVVAFLNKLIGYGMMSHVDVIKTEKKIKDKKKDDRKVTEVKKEKTTAAADEKESKEEKKVAPSSPRPRKDGKESKKVKKKVKTTLDYNDLQVFIDHENEAYVWTYDPLSWTTLILGILLVLAVILICLFPLWPENIREYSWYVSVAGAIFVGAILVLAVLRYVIYGFLWLCTMGKLNFWMLPNLTAECGFFESFVPFYEYEMKGEKSKKSKRRGSSSDEKSNESKIENKTNLKDETDANLKESNENKNKNKENIEKDEQENTISVAKNNAEKENNIMNDKNESGEESSSGGSKDDDWVKIKKDDTADEIPNEVEC